MVDFKKLNDEFYARATPEERERIDAWHAREARYNITRRQIEATFTRYEGRYTTPNKLRLELHAAETKAKTIEMRIEDREGYNGRKYEIIQFIGGSTGYEAYELCEDFVKAISEDLRETEADALSICAGSVRYLGCVVSRTAVLDYLKEMRPQLFGLPTVRPAPPPRATVTF